MNGFADLNLIRFFDFYLMFTFAALTLRRVGQYLSAGRLVVAGPARWPRLLELLKQHRMIFLTWSTISPAVLALLLSLLQLAASRSIWPQAHLTGADLVEHWLALLVIAPVGLAMLALDVWGFIDVGQIDRKEIEKYFDTAEFWLRSRTAHVVRVFTFGIIHPRRTVGEEVQKALVEVGDMLSASLWWTTVTVGLRLAFGLALWSTWALTGG
jgi:hypothetical protein